MSKEELTKALDKAKWETFLCQTSASLLSSLMCSLKYSWDSKIPTACTDGITMKLNPEWFMSLPLSSRKTLIMHEIWHVARLHTLRFDGKNHKLWNIACDIKINNALKEEGYSFVGLEGGCFDPSYPIDAVEEDIYQDLLDKYPDEQSQESAPEPGFGKGMPSEDGSGESEDIDGEPFNAPNGLGDLTAPASKEDANITTDNVIRAMQQQKLSGKEATRGLGDVDVLIDQYLKPQVAWSSILMNFFNEHVPKEDTNWNKRNRRFRNIYLPSSEVIGEELSHLIYYIDVSGSVTDEQIQKFASEVFYVHSNFKPNKITIIPFDTQLREPIVITHHDTFPTLEFNGRGGTCLRPVREHILKNMPTAAIVFSDLWCEPMEPVKGVPLVWIVMDNPRAVVEEGIVAHIN